MNLGLTYKLLSSFFGEDEIQELMRRSTITRLAVLYTFPCSLIALVVLAIAVWLPWLAWSIVCLSVATAAIVEKRYSALPPIIVFAVAIPVAAAALKAIAPILSGVVAIAIPLGVWLFFQYMVAVAWGPQKAGIKPPPQSVRKKPPTVKK